jgi:hypothetical protein
LGEILLPNTISYTPSETLDFIEFYRRYFVRVPLMWHGMKVDIEGVFRKVLGC